MDFSSLFLTAVGAVIESVTSKAIEAGASQIHLRRVLDIVERQDLGAAERAVREAVEKARQEMLKAYGEEALRPDGGVVQNLVALLNHRPFVDEVSRKLLLQGIPKFDRLRQAYLDQDPGHSDDRWKALEPYLIQFFDAIERHLLINPTLGPLLSHLRVLATQLRMAEDLHVIADAISTMQSMQARMTRDLGSLLELIDSQNATLAQLVGLLKTLTRRPFTGPHPYFAEQTMAIERRYLEGLYAECNVVPLAVDAPPDAPRQRQPRLQHIYVDLDTRLPLTWERICGRLGIQSSECRAELERLWSILTQEPQQFQDIFSLDRSNLARATPKLLERIDESILAQIQPNKAERTLGLPPGTWETVTRPVSVWEAMQEYPQLVILGDPGSGKTTLTRRLAGVLAAAALEHLPPEERDWQEKLGHAFDRWLLPIRVTLSSWAKHIPSNTEGCADDLLNECIRVLSRVARLDDLYQKTHLLERVNADPPSLLLLLDGLDEVADPIQRKRLLNAVREFCKYYHRVPLLVTCRIRPYREKDHYHLPLPCAELAPLRREAIRAFAERWYEELAWAGYYEPERAQQATQRLLRAIFDPRRPELQDMAGIPLLLTMMARVNYDAPLPDSRAALYERFVAKLLWEWEQEKHDQGQSTRLQSLLYDGRIMSPSLERALNRLAYSIHGSQAGRNTVDISRLALREALERIHPGDETEKAEWAIRVLDLIDDRSGLIISVKQGEVYRFSHLTFQEYLAARWLATGSDFLDKFKAKIDQEPWREAIFLALGYQVSVRGDYDNALAVFDELMPDEDQVRQKWRRVLLLGQAYASLRGPEWARQASEERRARRVQEIIPQRLISLLYLDDVVPPRERAEAGNALARLGDCRKGVGVIYHNGRPVPDIDWILIPPSDFIMGSHQEQEGMGSETPQFICRLITAPYRISRYPITVAQYRCFVKARGYQEKRYWTKAGWDWLEEHKITGPTDYPEPFNLDNHPIVGVSWYEAVAFCCWLSEALGYEVRLPSEAEWERAARDTDGRIWPWGNEFSPERCNMRDTGIGATSPVGIFPSGNALSGATDMAGNVWEWCSTLWVDDYQHYESSVESDLEREGRRVVRGGSWLDSDRYVRCACRLKLHPSHRFDCLGFRVVSPSP